MNACIRAVLSFDSQENLFHVQPKIYSQNEHSIELALIDKDALFVVEKLRSAGYEAFLVGGSVRDLLAKRIPKDYDISTSARPEQIKQLFQRSCLLIGRRFRLAHIRFGHKIIEVSTFRSGENEDDLIVHDNKWGTPEEDVLRRDFTMNGLFYDASTHSIIDYVGGWEDIKHGILKTIGEPKTRFRQDPVRMIRLLKFQARFGFQVDSSSHKALVECREEIMKSSPARVLEEIFRMLESGASAKFFRLMAESGLLELLFPSITHFLETKHGKAIYHYLSCADELSQYSRVTTDRAVLTACLLFPILETEVKAQFLSKGSIPHLGDLMLLSSSLIKNFVTSSFSHFPRRISSTISYILAMQYRLTPLSGRRHPRPKLLGNKEFAHALRFLKIRALVDDRLIETYNYWRDLYRQGPKQHERHNPPPKHSTPQRSAPNKRP